MLKDIVPIHFAALGGLFFGITGFFLWKASEDLYKQYVAYGSGLDPRGLPAAIGFSCFLVSLLCVGYAIVATVEWIIKRIRSKN